MNIDYNEPHNISYDIKLKQKHCTDSHSNIPFSRVIPFLKIFNEQNILKTVHFNGFFYLFDHSNHITRVKNVFIKFTDVFQIHRVYLREKKIMREKKILFKNIPCLEYLSIDSENNVLKPIITLAVGKNKIKKISVNNFDKFTISNETTFPYLEELETDNTALLSQEKSFRTLVKMKSITHLKIIPKIIVTNFSFSFIKHFSRLEKISLYENTLDLTEFKTIEEKVNAANEMLAETKKRKREEEIEFASIFFNDEFNF